jgi:hypothetical protein
MDSMNAYAQGLQEQVRQTAADIADYVKNRTVERARANEEWAHLADEIEVWSQDGKYVVGIRDNELASQAFQIEYGDETRPPAPLFRLMGRDLADAHQQASAAHQ